MAIHFGWPFSYSALGQIIAVPQWLHYPAGSPEVLMEHKPETSAIASLDRALRYARAKLSPDITAQRLLILIAVYFNEGLSQRELLKHLETTSITALSRNLADLSVLTTRKSPGPGLLELRVDPLNLRIKRVFLTRKGKTFMQRWLDTTTDLKS
jgi:DNA-binding MarR family transcriptional regulator